MLQDTEFYLVQDAAGRSMYMGHPAQDSDGRFPNAETATAAACMCGSIGDGETVYVTRHVRTVVKTVARNTEVTISQVTAGVQEPA